MLENNWMFERKRTYRDDFPTWFGLREPKTSVVKTVVNEATLRMINWAVFGVGFEGTEKNHLATHAYWGGNDYSAMDYGIEGREKLYLNSFNPAHSLNHFLRPLGIPFLILSMPDPL